MYALFAEATDTNDRKFMGAVWLSLNDVKVDIQRRIDMDVWPHFTIPIAVNLADDMNSYAYFQDIDDWEHIGRMVHETN